MNNKEELQKEYMDNKDKIIELSNTIETLKHFHYENRLLSDFVITTMTLIPCGILSTNLLPTSLPVIIPQLTTITLSLLTSEIITNINLNKQKYKLNTPIPKTQKELTKLIIDKKIKEEQLRNQNEIIRENLRNNTPLKPDTKKLIELSETKQHIDILSKEKVINENFEELEDKSDISLKTITYTATTLGTSLILTSIPTLLLAFKTKTLYPIKNIITLPIIITIASIPIINRIYKNKFKLKEEYEKNLNENELIKAFMEEGTTLEKEIDHAIKLTKELSTEEIKEEKEESYAYKYNPQHRYNEEMIKKEGKVRVLKP